MESASTILNEVADTEQDALHLIANKEQKY